VSTEADSAPERGLRRELRFWEAIALSIGIMAPGAAMALNGTLPASLVGRAVPLAFVFASVGILFVSYAFIRLTGYFNHAGSVYALSGVTLGPVPASSPAGPCLAPTWPSPPPPPPRWASSGRPSSPARASGRTPSGS